MIAEEPEDTADPTTDLVDDSTEPQVESQDSALFEDTVDAAAEGEGEYKINISPNVSGSIGFMKKEDGSCTVDAEYGKDIQLFAYASETGPDGSPVYNELTYIWKLDSEESGTNSSSYSLTNVTKEHTVTCDVLDETTKASASATFNVRFKKIRNDTEGAVWDNGHYVVKTTPGAACQLKVSNMLGETASDIVSYSWYSSDNVSVENTNSAVLDIPSVDKTQDWYCNAQDKDGNYYSLSYHIMVDTGLDATSDSGTETYDHSYSVITSKPEVSLKAEVICNAETTFTYRWSQYKDGELKDLQTKESTKETVDTYEASSFDSYDSFYCVISDEYGNTVTLSFRIVVPQLNINPRSNGNYVITQDENGPVCTTYVQPGENLNLFTGTSVYPGKPGTFTYTWDGDSVKAEEDYPFSATVENIDKSQTVTCTVSESKYGLKATATFRILLSAVSSSTEGAEWDADEKWYSLIKKPGDSCELKVSATEEGYSYSWTNQDDPDQKVVGTDASLKLSQVKTSTWVCTATKGENKVQVRFHIDVYTALFATGNGYNDYGTFTIFVPYNGSTVLSVTPSSDVANSEYEYHWSSNGSRDIPEATEHEYKIEKVSTSEYYFCMVSDAYNNSVQVVFSVNVIGNNGTLSEETALTDRFEEEKTYAFVPNTNATYAFYSTGENALRGYLLDQFGNVIASNDDSTETELNFRIESRLTKGKTYYLFIYYLGDEYTRAESSIQIDNICQHSWKTVTTNATYTAPGEQHEECSICGLVKNSRVLPVLVKPAAPAPAAPAPAVSAPAASAPAQVDNITIPKKPASVKAKAKKNKVTVSWKKIKKTKKTKALLKKIKKVEIQYSTDKTFATGAKTKKVSGKKTKVTLKLKKKTTYYVRVRYSDGKGGYSKWSKVKKVKTKK